MKSCFYFYFPIFFISVFVNCSTEGDVTITRFKTFWARKVNLTAQATSQYQVTAQKISSSKNAAIYVDVATTVPTATIDKLISTFENSIVPVEHLWLTTPMDVNGDGKVILLLHDIQDGYTPGSSFVAGYFDAVNQYTDQATTSQLGLRSNFAEMLYLDTYPSDPTATTFYATIAHEYQHLLQFSFNYPTNTSEEVWVDEGLSEVMSDITGFGPQTGRGDYFKYSIFNSDPLIEFNNSDLLQDYASSYMYFRYLYDIYGLGGISQIFRATQTGVTGVDKGIQNVDSAITTHCSSIAGLTFPYFGCSYRLMWAGLVNTLGSLPASADLNYNGSALTMPTTGGTNYNWNTADSAWTQTIVNTLLAGSRPRPAISTGTGNLKGYAPILYRTNYPAGAAATFSVCASCSLSIIAGSSYFVVFNHDPTASITHTGSVLDTQVVAQVSQEGSVQLSPPVMVDPIVAGQKEDPHGRAKSREKHDPSKARHWHFPLSGKQMKGLRGG